MRPSPTCGPAPRSCCSARGWRRWQRWSSASTRTWASTPAQLDAGPHRRRAPRRWRALKRVQRGRVRRGSSRSRTCPPGTWSTSSATARCGVEAHGYFSLNMAASRGCPFRCNWCAKPIWGNQYPQRSADAVAAEIHLPQAPLRSRPHLVRRRHLRLPARLGAALRARRCARPARACPSPSRSRADLISEAHGRRRCASAGCARGLDRRRERQPAHPRRDEQGHDGGGDPHRARAPARRRASASASSSSSATSASS